MSQTALRSSMLSSTSHSTKAPIFPARQMLHNGSRRPAKTCAYRGGNCGRYGQGGWRGGMFQMNPNEMEAASNVMADIMSMARRWQAANPNSGFPQNGFPQNGNNNSAMQLPLLVDLEEGTDDYTLTADVPGLLKSDLKIQVNQKERTLTISGERKRAAKATAEPVDAQEQEQEQPKQQQQYRQRLERPMGKFQRTLQRVPKDADLSSVSARVEKGVLSITVKKMEQKPSDDLVEINIE